MSARGTTYSRVSSSTSLHYGFEKLAVFLDVDRRVVGEYVDGK